MPPIVLSMRCQYWWNVDHSSLTVSGSKRQNCSEKHKNSRIQWPRREQRTNSRWPNCWPGSCGEVTTRQNHQVRAASVERQSLLRPCQFHGVEELSDSGKANMILTWRTKERTTHQLKMAQLLARLMYRCDHLAEPSGASIGGMPVIASSLPVSWLKNWVTLKLTCKNGRHSTNVGTSCWERVVTSPHCDRWAWHNCGLVFHRLLGCSIRVLLNFWKRFGFFGRRTALQEWSPFDECGHLMLRTSGHISTSARVSLTQLRIGISSPPWLFN